MRIKSYFAQTVEDAMAAARIELGPEAMLVNSRKAPPDVAATGEYEVVFATDAPEERQGPAAASAAVSQGDLLSREVAQLKRELEGVRRALTRSAFTSSHWFGASPDFSDAYGALTSNEVAPELARDIVQSAAVRAQAARPETARGPQQRIDPEAFQRAIAEELESRIKADATLGRGEGSPRIAALVGPPGAGKTTTLVKLAVNYGLAGRRPSLLLSMDTYRVAAAEQLRAYAAILGLGFQVLETVTALAQAIEENRGKELILIDTPGFGFGDMDQAAPLARFLSERKDIDTHLVISSSMKSGDMTRLVDSFEIFTPQRLIFTKLDETGSFGPILNEAARTGKSLSFFGTGQRIPEDMETADAKRLTDLVLLGPPARARSAA
jgi:flagellar biosynthesis protein FlhF